MFVSSVCVYELAPVCVRVCMYALRIVFTDKTLRFINTFVFIITVPQLLFGSSHKLILIV